MLRVHRPPEKEGELTSAKRQLLESLEASDCKCISSTDPIEILRAGPCEHVLAADHTLSLDEWRELQELLDPGGYRAPPEPTSPALAVTREARLALLESRAHGKVGLWHPFDLDATKVDAVSVDGRRVRNGAAQFGGLRLTRRAA
jgi:hypothetical protein